MKNLSILFLFVIFLLGCNQNNSLVHFSKRKYLEKPPKEKKTDKVVHKEEVVYAYSKDEQTNILEEIVEHDYIVDNNSYSNINSEIIKNKVKLINDVEVITNVLSSKINNSFNRNINKIKSSEEDKKIRWNVFLSLLRIILGIVLIVLSLGVAVFALAVLANGNRKTAEYIGIGAVILLGAGIMMIIGSFSS